MTEPSELYNLHCVIDRLSMRVGVYIGLYCDERDSDSRVLFQYRKRDVRQFHPRKVWFQI